MDASDNHSLASIEIQIEGFGPFPVKTFSCADHVLVGSHTVPLHTNNDIDNIFFDPSYPGIATVTDCCGNVTTQDFDLFIDENGLGGPNGPVS